MTLNSTISLLLLSMATHQELTSELNTRPQLVRTKFVLDVIKELQWIHNFESIVYYVTKELDNHIFFQDFWKEFSIVPKIIISESSDLRKYPMAGFLKANVMCVVFTTNGNDPILDVAAKSLTGVRYFKTLFVLFPVLKTLNVYDKYESFTQFNGILEEMYKSIWRREFLSTLLLTINDNVYMDDPYPLPIIVNKTMAWNAKDFFPKHIYGNRKGYVVDTPVGYDMPRVFPLPDRNRNKTKDWISGFSGILIKEFMANLNVTLIDTSKMGLRQDTFDIYYILNKIIDKTVEICIHTCTFMKETPIGSSYPVGINDWCIMVPYQNRTEDHLYLQQAFKGSTWLLIIFVGFSISLTVWLSTPQQSRDYSASLLQAICSLLCIVPTSVISRRTLRMRCLFVSLFLFGFIISNLYTTKMASFLTTKLDAKQIDDIDDIIARKLMIMVMDFEYEHLEKLPSFTPKLLDYIMVVDRNTMNLHRDVLNTTYGYSVTTDRWKYLHKQQRNLRKPFFRLSQICMGPFYQAYPIQTDSHFQSSLKYFIMFMSQQGLRHHWEDQTFADALRLKYLRMLKVDEEFVPLSINYFRKIWLVWYHGLMVAGLAFILEMKWPQVLQLGRCIVNFWKWVLSDL